MDTAVGSMTVRPVELQILISISNVIAFVTLFFPKSHACYLLVTLHVVNINEEKKR